MYEISSVDELGRTLVVFTGYYNREAHYFKIYPKKLIDKTADARARTIGGNETDWRRYE